MPGKYNADILHTNILIAAFCSAVLLGLCRYRLEAYQLITVLAITLLVMAALKWRSAVIAGIGILGLVIGNWRAGTLWPEFQEYSDSVGQNVRISGEVISDPVYGYKRQVDFFISRVGLDNGAGLYSLPGKVRIRGYGTINFKRGDFINAQGRLSRGYGSYQAAVSFADYRVIAKSSSAVLRFRQHFIAATQSVLPEPQASLGLGFIAGIRDDLPQGLQDNLSVTGLTHIVAVSGYNTTILALAARRYLGRFSRYLALAGTIIVLIAFLGITGLAASVVRAAIVTVMSTTAWYYGRSFASGNLLLGSAAISALISPLGYWFDLGWWLSFTAFSGIIILAPLIKKRFFKHRPRLIGNILLETSCAQLMTLPLILWVFHRLSVVAVLANVLVLPLIPLAMLGTFLAGLIGMVVPVFAAVAAWPARLLLSYVVDITDLLAAIPGASRILTITRPAMLMSYLVAGIMASLLYWRIKQKRPL